MHRIFNFSTRQRITFFLSLVGHSLSQWIIYSYEFLSVYISQQKRQCHLCRMTLSLCSHPKPTSQPASYRFYFVANFTFFFLSLRNWQFVLVPFCFPFFCETSFGAILYFLLCLVSHHKVLKSLSFVRSHAHTAITYTDASTLSSAVTPLS